MDPTALAFALIAALGGAALTAVAASIGAIWQSKREHKKWLRERRFDAYKEFVPAMRGLDLHFAAITSVKHDLDALNDARPAVPDASYTGRVDRLRLRLDAATTDEKPFTARALDSMAAVTILGPTSVTNHVESYFVAIRVQDNDAITAAEDKLLAAMRKAVRVTRWSRG
ncbi:MAG TPA: hypothetical protein VN041_07175 [Microbacterium sp.]|nr:hypothetical protein [Microbacterium sp.]